MGTENIMYSLVFSPKQVNLPLNYFTTTFMIK